jgi:hypothetical protein
MPTTRTATAITFLPVAILALTIIQKSLIAIESIVQETRIKHEMMAMLQRGTDITNEIAGTQIAEIVIEMLIQEAAVTVSPIPSYRLLPLLRLVASVLWLPLLMVQMPPSKDATAST